MGEKNKAESSPVNNTKLQGDEDPTVICTVVENEIESKNRPGDNRQSANGQDADAVLDDLLDKIDMSSVLSEDTLKSNKKSATRVVLAAKDYNPMEREKSMAKRKAMEQEIVRQTAEFDRLAQLSKDQRVAESKGEKSVHDSCSNKLKEAGTSDAKSNKVRKTLRLNLSQNDWTKIMRCLVLVVIGSYVGKLFLKSSSCYLSYIVQPDLSMFERVNQYQRYESLICFLPLSNEQVHAKLIVWYP